MTASLSPKDELRYKLLGSFLDFTRYFFKERTGNKFDIQEPPGRRSHITEIAKALTKVKNGDTKRLIINVPPRYGKSELCISFIAWSLARNPASQFIYVSYGHSLAATQTAIVRNVLCLAEYRRLFPNVQLDNNTNAKDNFRTTYGGGLFAAGRGGSILGRGAGVRNSKEFAGAIIIDDILNSSEATSDTVRKASNDFYYNTLLSRLNDGEKTPIIFIGQRLHEDDLAANLIAGQDGHDWEKVIMPALDHNGCALFPAHQSAEYLEKRQKIDPYNFSAQYQQNPSPAGGSVFKPEWFRRCDVPDNITGTFITVDCAETDKTWNDATVFSFWGVYIDEESSTECIHWLDSQELRVEPKDLKPAFLSFLHECRSFKVKPANAYIEKHSTGTTLCSVLEGTVGLCVIPLTRDKASKTERFLRAQPYAASRQISITDGASHTNTCMEHMGKITANNSHRHDDIADTFADAVKIALIDKTFNSQAETCDTDFGVGLITSPLITNHSHGGYTHDLFRGQ